MEPWIISRSVSGIIEYLWEPAGLMATVCVFHLSDVTEGYPLFWGGCYPHYQLQPRCVAEWTCCSVCESWMSLDHVCHSMALNKMFFLLSVETQYFKIMTHMKNVILKYNFREIWWPLSYASDTVFAPKNTIILWRTQGKKNWMTLNKNNIII